MNNAGDVHCCGCLRHFEVDESGEVSEVASASKRKEESVASPAAGRVREEEREKENPVSAALLKGWTMLSQSCPKCYQPIMQQPNKGPKWCVQCNVQVVTQDEFDAKLHKATTTTPTTLTPPPASAPAVQDLPRPRLAEPERRAPPAPPVAPARVDSPTTQQQLRQTKEKLLATLNARLAAAERELEGDIDQQEATSLLLHIQVLLATIQPLLSLSV